MKPQHRKVEEGRVAKPKVKGGVRVAKPKLRGGLGVAKPKVS